MSVSVAQSVSNGRIRALTVSAPVTALDIVTKASCVKTEYASRLTNTISTNGTKQLPTDNI